MALLMTTRAELVWLVTNLSSLELEEERRLVWLSAYFQDDQEIWMWGLEAEELWSIDTALLQEDLRAAKLPDGELLLTLAEKVWQALLEDGGIRATDDEDGHAHADHDPGDDPETLVRP